MIWGKTVIFRLLSIVIAQDILCSLWKCSIQRPVLCSRATASPVLWSRRQPQSRIQNSSCRNKIRLTERMAYLDHFIISNIVSDPRTKVVLPKSSRYDGVSIKVSGLITIGREMPCHSLASEKFLSASDILGRTKTLYYMFKLPEFAKPRVSLSR